MGIPGNPPHPGGYEGRWINLIKAVRALYKKEGGYHEWHRRVDFSTRLKHGQASTDPFVVQANMNMKLGYIFTWRKIV